MMNQDNKKSWECFYHKDVDEFEAIRLFTEVVVDSVRTIYTPNFRWKKELDLDGKITVIKL